MPQPAHIPGSLAVFVPFLNITMSKTEHTFTSMDVPPEFLEAAFFVGHIPSMTLQSDPPVSYSLYIPPDAYKALSVSKNRRLTILVNIHGTRRNLSAIYGDLRAFADVTSCVVL